MRRVFLARATYLIAWAAVLLLAPVARAQDPQPARRSDYLVAVAVQYPETVRRRDHPVFAGVDPHLLDPGLPAVTSPGDHSTKGVADHLGSKTNSDQLAPIPIQAANQFGKSDDPRHVFVDRQA